MMFARVCIQRRMLILAAVLAPFATQVSIPETAMGQQGTDTVRLPPPSSDGEMSVETAILRRRSTRSLASTPLELGIVSQLLWAAQGVTNPDGKRTAPSAGALYPLEVFLVTGDVHGLTPGVYRYIPQRHELIQSVPGDRRAELSAAALNQPSLRSAPAVIVITGVVSRTAARYGQRAARYVHIEVGSAAENVYLQATARGLATVLVGAFNDDRVKEALGLPEDYEPFCMMPVAWPE